MGDFAAQCRCGLPKSVPHAAITRFSAQCDIRDSQLFAALGQSIDKVILQHRTDLERKRKSRSSASKVDARWLEATSTSAGPKTRWIDGTPEYSLHVCGLLKLFPQALFIHLIRDVSCSRPLNGQLSTA